MPSAPQYLVYPVDWDQIASTPAGASLITNKASITDFGESYEISSPPQDLGIPRAYTSPEYTLDHKVGASSDVFALACTLFEVRTGRKLFESFDDDANSHLFTLAVTLGKFPEPWWETWAARKENFEDETDDAGRVVPSKLSPRRIVIDEGFPRSISEALAEGLVYEVKGRPESLWHDISAREIESFSDLLGKLLRYVPAERISAREALGHEWFKFREQPAPATPEDN